MIGTNYKSVPTLHLPRFQKVYTTHNGKEVSGFVQQCQGDQILISIPSQSDCKQIISRKPGDIRIPNNSYSMENKESIEDGNASKGRTVSASIEVPKASRKRKTSQEPTMTDLMAAMVLSTLSCSPVIHNQPYVKGGERNKEDILKTAKGFSPQSFGSSDLESWTWDSQPHTPNFSHSGASRQFSANSPEANQYKSYYTNKMLVHPDCVDAPLRPSDVSDDPIDSDSGMILLQPSTPTSTKNMVKQDISDMDISDEPQDLRMPKVVHIDRSTVPKSSSHSLQIPPRHDPFLGVSDKQKESEHKEEHVIPVPMALTQQIPFSYYFAPGFVHQPYAASLPAEFRIQLANTPPHRALSPDIGSSASGYRDSKAHRHLHRPAPYHKVNDDLNIPSPESSSSKLTFGSAPTEFYPFTNSPIPVGSLSFSPLHHAKQHHIRSPLASSSQTSSNSSPAKTTKIMSASLPAGYAATIRDRPYPNCMTAQSINIPAGWQGNVTASYLPKSSIVQQRQQIHQAASPKMAYNLSPKTHPLVRKVPGDGKKCRKVFGMENKEMWCTACRWKKACQRYPD